MNGIIHILVADDFEPWRRALASFLLQNPEWQVVCEVSDGLEAVQKAQELKPDLILLDIGLPKLDGIKAARRIREVAPNSKILFVSTHTDSSFVEAALATGAYGYVVKTDAGGELIPAVEAVLQGKRFISSRLRKLLSDDNGSNQNPTGLPDYEVPALASALPREKELSKRHEVFFYTDDGHLLDGFAQFIEAALKRGDSAIVFANESHRNALLTRLRSQVSDIAAVMGQGTYIAVDNAEILARIMVGGEPDRERCFESIRDLMAVATAAQQTSHHVTICGECAPLLWARGEGEMAVRVEQLFNEILETHDVEILCGYPARSSYSDEDRGILRSICAEHTAVIPAR